MYLTYPKMWDPNKLIKNYQECTLRLPTLHVGPSTTDTCGSNLHHSDGLDWRYRAGFMMFVGGRHVLPIYSRRSVPPLHCRSGTGLTVEVYHRRRYRQSVPQLHRRSGTHLTVEVYHHFTVEVVPISSSTVSALMPWQDRWLFLCTP